MLYPPTEVEQRRRVTPAEAEASALELLAFLLDDVGRAPPDEFQRRRPFGAVTDQWARLVTEMRDGDELWERCSAKSTWDELGGRYVFELVRAGRVVASACVMKS